MALPGHCLCGSTLRTLVFCSNETGEVGVLDRHCLTSDGDNSNISVVGSCLATAKLASHQRMANPLRSYQRVKPNISDQNSQTCGSLNRQGLLCGQCKPNHSVSAYSYDLKCYPCTSSVWSGFVKYICVAYLPLTVFLCVVVVFRISVTSPAMNTPVLCCQMISLPFVVQYMLLFTRFNSILHAYTKVFMEYGTWTSFA